MIDKIIYHPIGIIHSPHTNRAGMPIQPAGARGIKGTIDILAEYQEGLYDLDGFSHIILLYHLHQSIGFKLSVKPFLDDQYRGLFSCRAPRRPNPIGLSVVRLTAIKGRILYVEDLDILDGTPLLDIKPFVPHFDNRPVERIGWLENKIGRVEDAKADQRFF